MVCKFCSGPGQATAAVQCLTGEARDRKQIDGSWVVCYSIHLQIDPLNFSERFSVNGCLM